MKILFKSLLIAVVLSSVSAHAGTTIYHDGDTTYVDSDKGSTTYKKIGDRVFGSDGSNTYQAGNRTFRENKDGPTISYYESASIIFGTDGSRKQTIGKYTYITDANGKTQTCYDEGPRTFCN